MIMTQVPQDSQITYGRDAATNFLIILWSLHRIRVRAIWHVSIMVYVVISRHKCDISIY